MTFSVPGKTFLLGEYLALAGGPSILLATGPRFAMRVKEQVSLASAAAVPEATVDAPSGSGPSSAVAHPFHPQSPAGKYLVRHHRELARFSFDFIDPYLGKGGLGASSAQWVLLHMIRRGQLRFSPENFDWSELLDEYRTCAWSGEGAAPSGADVVAQLCGGITYYDGLNFKARRLEWVFPKLAFTLVRTGEKLATHEHLKKPQLAPHEAMRTCVSDALLAFESASEELLIDSVRRYAKALSDTGRVTLRSKELLSELSQHTDWALAAKGCGAMGADVILILHSSERANAARLWAQRLGLEVGASRFDLEPGFRAD